MSSKSTTESHFAEMHKDDSTIGKKIIVDSKDKINVVHINLGTLILLCPCDKDQDISYSLDSEFHMGSKANIHLFSFSNNKHVEQVKCHGERIKEMSSKVISHVFAGKKQPNEINSCLYLDVKYNENDTSHIHTIDCIQEETSTSRLFRSPEKIFGYKSIMVIHKKKTNEIDFRAILTGFYRLCICDICDPQMSDNFLAFIVNPICTLWFEETSKLCDNPISVNFKKKYEEKLVVSINRNEKSPPIRYIINEDCVYIQNSGLFFIHQFFGSITHTPGLYTSKFSVPSIFANANIKNKHTLFRLVLYDDISLEIFRLFPLIINGSYARTAEIGESVDVWNEIRSKLIVPFMDNPKKPKLREYLTSKYRNITKDLIQRNFLLLHEKKNFILWSPRLISPSLTSAPTFIIIQKKISGDSTDYSSTSPRMRHEDAGKINGVNMITDLYEQNFYGLCLWAGSYYILLQQYATTSTTDQKLMDGFKSVINRETSEVLILKQVILETNADLIINVQKDKNGEDEIACFSCELEAPLSTHDCESSLRTSRTNYTYMPCLNVCKYVDIPVLSNPKSVFPS